MVDLAQIVATLLDATGAAVRLHKFLTSEDHFAPVRGWNVDLVRRLSEAAHLAQDSEPSRPYRVDSEIRQLREASEALEAALAEASVAEIDARAKTFFDTSRALLSVLPGEPTTPPPPLPPFRP
jgi:hypothetical protein